MPCQRFAADDRHGLVRWKVVAIIAEHEEIKSGDQAVSGVPGDQVDLFILERAVEESEIHNAWRFCKSQAVGRNQALVSVRALHELVTKSRTPLWCIGSGLRNGLQVQPSRVFAAN